MLRRDLYVYLFSALCGIYAESKDDTVETALDYVFQLQASKCGDLVIGDVLPLQFDVTAWEQYADPAVRTANLLSKIIHLNNGTLDSLTDDMFFLMVRNNVHGDSVIFGSALAFEIGVYRCIRSSATKAQNFYGLPFSSSQIFLRNRRYGIFFGKMINNYNKKTKMALYRSPETMIKTWWLQANKYDAFAPYAYKSNKTVRSHDLSINYDYLDPEREWYNTPKNTDRTNITVVTDGVMYRKNNDSLPEVKEVYPVAMIYDGHWTNPYYDCGGGEIWMVTYSAPILRIKDGKKDFQGVATIDIELTHIDINQCNSDQLQAKSGLDIFRGTHKCQPTTTCVPLIGKGFVPGAYHCVCNDGFYFPDLTSEVKAYTGEQIERWIRSTGEAVTTQFRCDACAAGCETCIDDSPCLHQRNEGLIITLLILNLIAVIGIIAIAVATYLYRHEMVMKSASPIFLEFMCLGGVLICAQFFMFYPDVTMLTCSFKIWPRHLGFFIMYGSLVLKTWRISMIFTVGTQKRVRLPDKVLLQRLGLLLLLVVAVLSSWNASQPPKIETLRTSEDLKFFICSFGPWQFAVVGAEIIFLLYGVYLCFTVRKAPAHFNESKHITWAVYNAIILGSFMSFMSRLFISVIGPDFMLLFQFAQMQVYATFTILIIFGPKFWAIKRKIDFGTLNLALATQQTVNSVTGRMKKNQVSPIPTVPKVHKATQTDLAD